MEINKMIPVEMRTGRSTEEPPEFKDREFNLYDHMERLRFIDTELPEQENKLLSKVLESALPGLEQFLNDDRHATLKGKMRYNAIGICYGAGRDDKASR